MKENMKIMQLTFCTAQAMNDVLYSICGLRSNATIPLPPKFKVYDAKKFDGTGDATQHVRWYIILIEMNGLDDNQTFYAVPLSLTKGALRRYYNLNPSNKIVWSELVDLFVKQFFFNTMIDVTLNDFKTTK